MLILCVILILIGIFGCGKSSNRSVAIIRRLIQPKQRSKGSNSKTAPEEVLHTQAQSQIIKSLDHQEEADSAQAEKKNNF